MSFYDRYTTPLLHFNGRVSDDILSNIWPINGTKLLWSNSDITPEWVNR